MAYQLNPLLEYNLDFSKSNFAVKDRLANRSYQVEYYVRSVMRKFPTAQHLISFLESKLETTTDPTAHFYIVRAINQLDYLEGLKNQKQLYMDFLYNSYRTVILKRKKSALVIALSILGVLTIPAFGLGGVLLTVAAQSDLNKARQHAVANKDIYTNADDQVVDRQYEG